jgi:hypothetical protein
MKRILCAVLLSLAAVPLTACAVITGLIPTPEPAPTVTVTATPAPAADEWQRFRDDPKSAFIFASAYEMIWGSPIGNGETADTMVSLAYSLCRSVEKGTQTWDSMRVDLGSDDSADRAIATAQVYCPEVE